MPWTLRTPAAPRLPLAFLLAAGLAAQAAPPAADPPEGLAYVSHQAGDIGVIDLATLRPAGSLPAHGPEPRGLGVSADGRLLAVANRGNGKLAVIDRRSGRLIHQVAIGANPEFVRVRGALAFVSYEPSARGKPPAAGAHGADEDDDDDAREPARIAVVDLRRGRVLQRIVGGPETEGLEFSADGRHLLVTNEADDTVSVHRLADGRRVHTVDLKPYGVRPRGVKIAPDGRSYAVSLEFSRKVVILNAGYEVVQEIHTGESPYGLAYDARGERLFVASSKSRLLQVFDAQTYAPLRDIPVGERCWHFSFTPDGRRLLLACGRSHEVLAIDATSLEVVGRIDDAKLPWGVVTYPKAFGSLDQPGR